MASLYGPDNLPVEMILKVRPAERPDMQYYVADYVAGFFQNNGITEQMIRDVSMEIMQSGEDADGSFTQVRVRLSYT